VEPENGVPASSETFGEMFASEDTSPTARSLSELAVKAEIAIGTCWTFSARFCAVTTISAIPPLSSAAVVCSCAWTCAGSSVAKIVTKAVEPNSFIILPPLVLLFQA
jgi:hypothetical protein